jgi:hypothetical protein
MAVVSWDGCFLDFDTQDAAISISKDQVEKMLVYLIQAFISKGGLGSPSPAPPHEERKFTVVDSETGQKYSVTLRGSRIISWKPVEEEKNE